MRRPLRRLTFFLTLVVALVAHAESRPLIIATYNIQNYTLTDRRLPEGYRPDYPKPEAEKTALRAVLRAIDADVIVLQEIGGAPFLAELRRDLELEGSRYPFGDAMLANDDKRGLAVLSRVPLGKITAHTDLRARRRGADADTPVRRGMLQVEIPWEGGALTLFVVHLKSRLGVDKDDPQATDQRVAEAQAARDRVLQIFPEPASARFLILGDFNDLPGSRALQAFEARGKTKIARALEAEDSRGHRWTHVAKRLGLYSRFDHALVSAGLADAVSRAWIADSPEVELASDHRPLVIELSDVSANSKN